MILKSYNKKYYKKKDVNSPLLNRERQWIGSNRSLALPSLIKVRFGNDFEEL